MYNIHYDGDYTLEHIPSKEVVGLGGYDEIVERKFIVIDVNYFNKSSPEQQEILVFHELTHSQFGHYQHTDGTNLKGCPVSAMGTYMPNRSCAIIMLDYYHKELKAHFYEAD